MFWDTHSFVHDVPHAILCLGADRCVKGSSSLQTGPALLATHPLDLEPSTFFVHRHIRNAWMLRDLGGTEKRSAQ
jgi:hypothetical protein